MTVADIQNLIPQRKLAQMLGVTPETIMRWHREGIHGKKLTKIRIGRRVYYAPDDVRDFQERMEGGSR